MYIIIPACGRGERFKAAGYATVKPLISVYGESMIDKVISTLHLRADDDLYVVSNWGEAGSHKTITLEHETAGATETVLLALKELFKESKAKSDAPLLLLDCDAIYHCDVLSKFRELVSEASIRAAALCFEENEDEKESTPKFSYVLADESGLVSEVREKVRIGPLANTGAYWFASTKEFMQVADSIIQTSDFQLGEAYISCVLKAYLSQHLKVKAVQIVQTDYANVGTPACLETYLQQQGMGFLFDLDGTLADTTGAYVKAGQQLLASKGAFVDEEFFIEHISGLCPIRPFQPSLGFLSARLRKTQNFSNIFHLLRTYRERQAL
jgi:dTDP-glucose pyrophosphorylase